MQKEQMIKVKAMCLLIQDGFVLVADGATLKSKVRKVVPQNFYRVLGGSFNFDESAEEAVRREIMEEAGVEIEDLTFLKVVENRFIYAGEVGHEIVFLFKGAPKSRMDTTKIVHIDEGTYEGDAVWVTIPDLLEGTKPLYPELDYTPFLNQ